MNNIHYEAVMISPCNCLLMGIWFIYKSVAFFLFFYTCFVSAQGVVSMLDSLQSCHYLLKAPFW
jgi:hypothetical protein